MYRLSFIVYISIVANCFILPDFNAAHKCMRLYIKQIRIQNTPLWFMVALLPVVVVDGMGGVQYGSLGVSQAGQSLVSGNRS